MTRKDFEELAFAIGGVADFSERGRMAKLVGKVCERHNNRFDWNRWNLACNITKVASVTIPLTTEQETIGY